MLCRVGDNMASITDCVVEGLKYPFTDLKKLLSFGALFAIVNIISLASSVISIDLIRKINGLGVQHISQHLSKVPMNDVYIIAFLAIVSFIISLIILGYQYNVMKFSIDRKNDLPEFRNILNLLINGLKFFIVCLAYNIVPVIALLMGIELINLYNSDYFLSIISIVLFIICNFLLIMGLANMVDSGKFIKAFDLRKIIDKIANFGWIKYVGIIIFTFIINGIIVAAISVIFMFLLGVMAMLTNQALVITAVITIIEGVLISPYISLFMNRVFGSIYREAIK